jgi:ubiquinone/menaquinone biosynthesis C-methylase UbiE
VNYLGLERGIVRISYNKFVYDIIGFAVRSAAAIKPAPLKSVARLVYKIPWIQKILADHLKVTTELDFQKLYVKQFEANPSMILEDWKTYHDLDKILEICKIQSTTKVLDVGCGISTVLHWIDGERYGIDPLAEEYMKIYSYPEGIRIAKASGEEIPFPNEYFDVVFCSNALDHFSKPERAIDEIHRVLKAGGYFVLAVEFFEGKKPRDFAHPHTFTKEYAYSLLETKFRVVFEKETLMNAIGSRKRDDKEEFFLIPSPNRTKELVILGSKV